MQTTKLHNCWTDTDNGKCFGGNDDDGQRSVISDQKKKIIVDSLAITDNTIRLR